MAIELEPFNVKSITLSPVGGCVTEIVSFPDGESTDFVGRAAVALAEKASQEELKEMNGKLVFTAELAEKYEFFENGDTTGEINASRIKAAREMRKVISHPMFQYQTKRNLLQYNTETLPFNLSDSNTAEWADFFPGAKPD